MDRYGIATAITGDKNNPRFHANVIKLQGDSVKPISAKRQAEIDQDPTKQRRLVSDVHFEHMKKMSFEDSLAPQDTKATAKRFLALVKDVVKLQAAEDDSVKNQVPVLLGENGLNGFDYYPKKEIYQAFLASLKKDIDLELIDKVQFDFGHFNHEDYANPNKVEDLSLYEDDEVNKQLKADLKDPFARPIVLGMLINVAKQYAETFAKEAPMRKRENLRFTKYTLAGSLKAHPKLAFLGFDAEIERAFIDSYKKKEAELYEARFDKEIPRAHFSFVYKDQDIPFFADVIKTHLLDQLESQETGVEMKQRFKDKSFKALLKKDLSL